ncbi:MAG: TIGR01212 family radical SAM protein, partial [bacterium]
LDAVEYPVLVADFLERLTPWMVIHRLLADAPDDLLIAPLWPARQEIILGIREQLHSRCGFQGKLWPP